MRIALLTHFFPPEIGAPQARLSAFARLWAEAGHDVTVLTGMPNHPSGVVPEEYRTSLVVCERQDGYRIVRTWLYATPNEGVAKKTLSHLSHMFSAALLGSRRLGKIDIVVVSSPTFFSMFSGWWISRVKRARLVVEIRDLWPALIVELGILNNQLIIRVLEAAELWIYGQADAVVVVSNGFRENLLARGVRASKVTTITNGVDLARFSESVDPQSVRATYLGCTPGRLFVLYLGTHGLSQGLSSVIEAAALLQNEPMQFVFVGEGADKSRIEDAARTLNLKNVSFHPAIPRDTVPSVIAAADVLLVPLRDEPILDHFIPSKIFEAMAVGTPIIGAVRGESAEILESAGAIVVPPESPHDLAEALVRLAEDPPHQPEYALRSRTLVETTYNRRQLATKYALLLESTVENSR